MYRLNFFRGVMFMVWKMKLMLSRLSRQLQEAHFSFPFSSLTFNHMSLYWEECATYDIWHMMRSYNIRLNVFFEQTKRFEKYFVFCKWSVDDAKAGTQQFHGQSNLHFDKETIQHSLICNHLLLLQQTFVLPYLRAEHFLECFELLFYWQRFEFFLDY